MKLNEVDLRAARPQLDMTKKYWKSYFNFMRILVQPSNNKRLNCHTGSIFTNDYLYGKTYQGETQWQRYCQYINSVLTTIRSGGYDYCYYIYQIADLLQFEHDRLSTEWLPNEKCFRVWLSNK